MWGAHNSKIGGAYVLVVAAVLPTARKQVLGLSLSERATADDAASLEISEEEGSRWLWRHACLRVAAVFVPARTSSSEQ